MTPVEQLLLVDFDGQPVTEPDGRPSTDPDWVITAAVDDPRHQERVGPLTDLLHDPATDGWDRFLACYALTAWAEPAGYAATIEAARDPERAPWRAASIDRRFAVDDTFAQLAQAVGQSSDLSGGKGTEELRIEALRALVAIAADQFFDWQLAFALDEDTLPLVRDDVVAVVRRGVDELAAGATRPFDLPTQLADLAAALTPLDEGLAVDLGHLVAGSASDSRRTLEHLAAIVGRGSGPRSLAFGDYLGLIGDQEVRRQVAEARAARG
jgi:hypothetical protein